MMQTTPELFARLLAKVWETVGITIIVPSSWTNGVLVPLHKSGRQDDPANYRHHCILSYIRKVLKKAVTMELEKAIGTDRMQFGFQMNISTL